MSPVWYLRHPHAPRRNEVHIWRVFLRQPRSCVDRLVQILSLDEQYRAAQFRYEKDRVNFVIARGALRRILGYYLSSTLSILHEPKSSDFGSNGHFCLFACLGYRGRHAKTPRSIAPSGSVSPIPFSHLDKVELRKPPKEIAFRYAPQGKPYLTEVLSHRLPLRFNLSHSHDWALISVSLDRELGVDVEFIRELVDMKQLVEHCFSAAERSALGKLPDRLQHTGFFNCWTKKEAYVKAIGTGLSNTLNSFTVPLDSCGEVQMFDAFGTAKLWLWSFWELTIASDYAAALIAEGKGITLRFSDYQSLSSSDRLPVKRSRFRGKARPKVSATSMPL